MPTTGIYILKDKDQRYKQLPDQPWPVTEEILKRFEKQGYVFERQEDDKRRVIFAKVD